MPYFQIPSKRDRPPRGIARIDWSSPFANGLVGLVYTGSTNVVDLCNLASTPTNTLVLGFDTVGLKWAGDGGSKYIRSGRRAWPAWELVGPLTFSCYWNLISGPGGTLNMAGNTAGVDGYSLWSQYGTNRSFSAASGWANVSGAWTIGQPSLATGTYDRANCCVYDGGILRGTGASTGDVTYNATYADVFIGATPDGGGYLNGALYWMGLWNRARSNAEERDLARYPFAFLAPDSRRVLFFAGAGGTGATAYEIDAQPGGYTVSGTAATLARGIVIDAQPAAYTVSGTAASVVRGYNLDAQPGSYTATGTAATLVRGLMVNAAPGSFALTGIDATLEYVQPGAYTIDAQPGAYSLTGVAATLTYTPLNAYTLDAQPASYIITGIDAALTYTGASIWTDISVSATTWGDVGGATSIWTDL